MNALYFIGYILVVAAYSGKLIWQCFKLLKTQKKSQETLKKALGKVLPDLIFSLVLAIGYIMIFHGKLLGGGA